MADPQMCSASVTADRAAETVVDTHQPAVAARRDVGVVGLFDDVNQLIDAARHVRAAGLRRWDCHTPYPVHGLDRAMGLRESRIGLVVLGCGFLGLLVAIALTGGLSVFHYPIRIGGKPLFSWQAFVPIYFELFVLFAALATMGSVIVCCRLGRWHSPLQDSGIMAEITRDRFAIVLYHEPDGPPLRDLHELLRQTNCSDIRPLFELPEPEEAA